MEKDPTTLTIPELEAILATRGLTAVREEYATERDYCITKGWNPKHASTTPMVFLHVKNPYHEYGLSFLFFIRENGVSDFWDMYFGDYTYELFNYSDAEEDLPALVERTVDEALNDKLHIITWSKVRDVPHGIDSAYWISDDPEEDNSAELAEAVARLRKKAAKGAWLFGKEGKFEVYSWNTYECIAPEKRK
jgi:hypothetical protein